MKIQQPELNTFEERNIRLTVLIKFFNFEITLPFSYICYKLQ